VESRRELLRPKQPQTQWDGEHGVSRRQRVVLDSMGELASLYRFADAVFVGGSLVPSGGHNIWSRPPFSKVRFTGPSWIISVKWRRSFFMRRGRASEYPGAFGEPRGLLSQGRLRCDADGSRRAGVGGSKSRRGLRRVLASIEQSSGLLTSPA